MEWSYPLLPRHNTNLDPWRASCSPDRGYSSSSGLSFRNLQFQALPVFVSPLPPYHRIYTLQGYTASSPTKKEACGFAGVDTPSSSDFRCSQYLQLFSWYLSPLVLWRGQRPHPRTIRPLSSGSEHVIC